MAKAWIINPVVITVMGTEKKVDPTVGTILNPNAILVSRSRLEVKNPPFYHSTIYNADSTGWCVSHVCAQDLNPIFRHPDCEVLYDYRNGSMRNPMSSLKQKEKTRMLDLMVSKAVSIDGITDNTMIKDVVDRVIKHLDPKQRCLAWYGIDDEPDAKDEIAKASFIQTRSDLKSLVIDRQKKFEEYRDALQNEAEARGLPVDTQTLLPRSTALLRTEIIHTDMAIQVLQARLEDMQEY